MLGVEKLSSGVKVGLIAEELSSVDVAELVVLSLGLVVETLVLVVDSPVVVVVIKSVVV